MPENAIPADHQWFYMHGMFDIKSGPVSERELADLVRDGTIKAATKIFSPTRTKNQIVYAESIPEIRKLLDNIAAAKEAELAQEKERQAKRIAIQQEELAQRLAPKSEEGARRATPKPPPIETSIAPSPAAPPTQTIVIHQNGFHPQRIIVLIATLAGIAGVFMPWVQLPFFGAVSGSSGSDGWIMLGFFLPAFAVTLTPDWTRRIGFWMSCIACCFLMLNIAFSGFKIWSIWDEQNRPEESGIAELLGSAVQLGPGLFVILFASLVSMALLISFPEGKSKTWILKQGS